jgi:hypothetical protein
MTLVSPQLSRKRLPVTVPAAPKKVIVGIRVDSPEVFIPEVYALIEIEFIEASSEHNA